MSSTSTKARTIDAVTLRERLDNDPPRILDVRTPAEFESVHIAGSYNVPLDLLREHRKELLGRIDADVVLVCASGTRAGQAEQALAQAGLPGLRVLEGGMTGWERSGGPVNRGRQTWGLERQVRLVAGTIVGGSIAASTVKPGFKWVAAAVGVGLTVAALTDTCAMGIALSKMPWNRTTGAPGIASVLAALDGDDASR